MNSVRGQPGLALLFAVIHFGVAAEQAPSHLMPKTPPSADGEVIAAPQPEARDITDDVLVPALRGLVLFDERDELLEKGTETRVDLSRLAIPAADELAVQLAAYLGQSLTLKLLDDINRSIVQFGRDHDRPVIDAFAPEGQDITNGIVQILVVAGRLGRLQVEGLDDGAAARVQRQAQINSGAVITGELLRSELRWFNRQRFRRVNIVLERGEAFGETDLRYVVEQRRPFRLYGAVEDSGTRLSGKDRWVTGLNWGNVLGLDHQFNYQFTSAFDNDIVNAHSISYAVPFDWRHSAEVFAVHVDSNPERTIGGFILGGTSWQTGFRYRVPLRSFAGLAHELEFGYDYKQSDNDLEFGNLRIGNTETTVSQFVVGYAVDQGDRWGYTAASAQLVYSPGDMSDNNSDAAFAASRAGASSDYLYLEGSINRTTQLTSRVQWLALLSLQWANENLIGSETLGIGGYQSVRGYDDYELTADQGLHFRNEVRLLGFSPLAGWLETVRDQFVPLVFTDYGIARSAHPLPGEKTLQLWSAGVGFRYSVAPYLNVRFDYAWQLKDLITSQADPARAHFAVLVSY